ADLLRGGPGFTAASSRGATRIASGIHGFFIDGTSARTRPAHSPMSRPWLLTLHDKVLCVNRVSSGIPWPVRTARSVVGVGCGDAIECPGDDALRDLSLGE